MGIQSISMPDGLFYEFKKALRGTRFEDKMSGEINGSSAIRELMQSAIDERNQKEEMVEATANPTSDILQTTDEYFTKGIDKVLDIDPEIADEIIAKQEPGKQIRIYNQFDAISRNIVNRLKNTKTETEPESRIATENELHLLNLYKGRPEQEVISAVKKLRIEVKEGRLKIPNEQAV